MNTIYNYWAKAGGLLAIVIVAAIFIFYRTSLSSFQILACINLSLLMFHQFEEYVYPGGFKKFFNSTLSKPNGFLRFRLTDPAIICVNVVIGWGFFLIAALTADGNPDILVIALAISFINGLVHTIAFLVKLKYNPGLATGLFVFIPFTVYSFSFIFKTYTISSNRLFILLLISIAGSLIIPFTIYLFRNSDSKN